MHIKLLVLFFLICTNPGISLGGTEPLQNSDNRLSNTNITYDPVSKRVQIRASKSQLDTLTKKFSAITRIDFLFIEPVVSEVTLDTDFLPLEVAISELLRDHNYVVVKDDTRARINKIIILPRGEDAAPRNNVAASNTTELNDAVELINDIITNAPVQPSKPVPEEAKALMTAISSTEFDRMMEGLPQNGEIRQAFESTREHWIKGLSTGYYRISPDALRNEESLSGFLGLSKTEMQK